MKEQNINIEYRYHHIGIPTDIVRPNEKYSEKFKVFTCDKKCFRIQFHRFEKETDLSIEELWDKAKQQQDLNTDDLYL